MAGFLRRGVRLARSNPRVFLVRLGMIARHPIRNTRALMSIAQRRERVERGYSEWLRESLAQPVEPPPDTGPTLSILMPVYNVDRKMLIDAVESVVTQSYPHWELCIADDASTTPHVKEVLREYALQDSRIRVRFREVTGHISAASNTALESATGEFVLLLDHDDILLPGALQHVADVIRDNPTVDFIYSDEDKIDLAEEHSDPFFKPGWSPTLLTSCNYITHLAAIRRSLVEDVGGFRNDVVGSQDHDLFLRVTEVARSVAHIPRVLYSWRMAPGSTALASSAKPYAVAAAQRAIEDTVKRRKLHATVVDTHLNGIFAIRPILSDAPISLIVSGVGSRWQRLFDDPGLDVRDVVYLDPSAPRKDGVAEVTRISDTQGEYLVCIDSESCPENTQSVHALLEQLQSPGAEIVGGMTVSPAGVLQAGLALSGGGQPVFASAGLPSLPHRHMYLNLKDLPHEVSAVWVGCCAMRSHFFARLGGWNLKFPADLAMVDLCLRANEMNRRVVYTPFARFRRDTPLPPISSVGSVNWPWRNARDPISNPNLDPSTPDGLPFRHAERLVSVRQADGCGEDD